jgi:hypothetical protein
MLKSVLFVDDEEDDEDAGRAMGCEEVTLDAITRTRYKVKGQPAIILELTVVHQYLLSHLFIYLFYQAASSPHHFPRNTAVYERVHPPCPA